MYKFENVLTQGILPIKKIERNFLIIFLLILNSSAVVMLLYINVAMGYTANTVSSSIISSALFLSFDIWALLFGYIMALIVVFSMHKTGALLPSYVKKKQKFRLTGYEFFFIWILLATNHIMSAITSGDGWTAFLSIFGLQPIIISFIGAALISYIRSYLYLNDEYENRALFSSVRKRRHWVIDGLLVFVTLEVNVLMGIELKHFLGIFNFNTLFLGVIGSTLFALIVYCINRLQKSDIIISIDQNTVPKERAREFPTISRTEPLPMFKYGMMGIVLVPPVIIYFISGLLLLK